MIRRAIARRYDAVHTKGRTEPLRVSVRTADGQDHDVFLKATGHPQMDVEGMANEALASLLAGDLGLPINEPFFVELSPAFVAGVADPAVRARLQASCPVCFASKDAGRQWNLWNSGEHILSDRRDMALAITAFDAFIENEDRRASRPNLLVKGSEFRLIDHELAFRMRMKLFPKPEPWKTGYLNNLLTADPHSLAIKLRKQSGLDFAPIKTAWTGLSDVRLNDYLTVFPPEWAGTLPHMREAITHLAQVRDRIDDCIAEMNRVLT